MGAVAGINDLREMVKQCRFEDRNIHKFLGILVMCLRGLSGISGRFVVISSEDNVAS